MSHITYSKLSEKYSSWGKWGLRGPIRIMGNAKTVAVRKKGGKFKNEWVGEFIYQDGDYAIYAIGKCTNCNMGLYECEYWNCASEDFMDLGMHWDIK